jgi:hypothetical protein
VTTTSTTPEHLRHHEFETEPFTPDELRAILEYEHGNADLLGADELTTLLAIADVLADRAEESTVDGDGLTAEQIRSTDRAHILACFGWLREWYLQLDSLKSGLRNGGEGPAHSRAGTRYLKQECTRWYRTLHLVRREACKYAFGTAGPQPEVDSGMLTFFDIPGIELDGTIAAESQ